MPSTVIADLHYDLEKKILTVVFQSGKIYNYLEVARGVYLTLKTARSKGGYFNKYIKGNYDFIEIQ